MTAATDAKRELARYLLEQAKAHRLDKAQAAAFLNVLTARAEAPPADIAIVGMACRFPGADSADAFWDNLAQGRNGIRPFPPARRAHLAALDGGRTPLFNGGFLESVDAFDNDYFQIPPNVARVMDPYHRLMLETLVETIEDAGQHRGALYGKPVGVFVGNDHTHRYFNNYTGFVDEVDFHAVTGSWTAVLASRISYLFNLRGPAVVVDTACSSGLVALDAAIKALRDGDCETALVGAANLFFAPGKGLVGEIENDSFEVRAFDRRAQGTAWGEGIAALMVKPLDKALRDGDPVRAVIRGIALNNDGASNGLTAPNAKAQQEVILKAWERAGVAPDAISYVETHGTGTPLGDPIEIKGLVGAFGKRSARRQFCGIGSVKTNIGHTVGVAGLASLIKVVLGLEHETLPPSLHFDEPNAFIDFCASPVYVVDRALPWPRGDEPRIAGVSSFSLSGTNGHVVVQEAPAVSTAAASDTPRLFVISARDASLWRETLRRHVAHFRKHPGADIADVCHTAGSGREHHALRAAVVVRSIADLRAALAMLLAASDDGLPAERVGRWHCGTASTAVGQAARDTRDAAVAHVGDAEALDTLAQLYVAGVPLPWDALVAGAPRRRARLPAQPFLRRHHWDKAPGATSPAAVEASTRDALPTREALVAAAADEAVDGLADADDALPCRIVARVWREVLGYERLRADDDYYALGGDSISAMRIVHVLNDVFGLRADVAVLLGAANLRDFAQALLRDHAFAARIAGSDDARDDGVARVPDAPHYALSRAQRRMFLLERLSAGSTAYHVNALVRLGAAPDPAAVEATMGQLVARHDSLRTAFEERESDVVQIVRDAVPFALERVRLPKTGDVDAALQAAMSAFVRPFDLAAPPLLRAALIEADDACWLALDLHHIVTDGSSMGVLVADYARLERGEVLSPPACRYRDYAAWQNRAFAAGAFDADAHYWRTRFPGEIPVLELATDYPRPAFKDFRGAKVHRTLDAALAARLHDLARAQSATLFVVLLAAFKTLLFRLGGGDDIVVGSPVAGRVRPEFDALVGMFVNTLALRDRVEDGDTFAGFLARVKANTLSALQHQAYPYEDLVEALDAPRAGGRNPLFDVCFALQNEDVGLAGDGIAVVPLAGASAKFDLTVMARDTGAGIAVDWEYATSLVDAATVARYADCFETLLRDIVARPHARLDELALLPDAERAFVVEQCNDTATDYDGDRGIAALFHDGVDRDPPAVAVTMGDTQLRYGELDALANRIAHALLARGVRRGDAVGLLFGRSIGMVAAILGVLKAGAAYVPLDPSSPPARSIAMLAETGATVLLAGGDLAAETWPCEVLHLDALDLDVLPASRPEIAVDGDDTAYVMFTSGSTGTPKGVVIRQRSVVRVVRANRYVAWDASDVCLSISNYTFDGSIPDLFGALLNGGRVVLLDPREVLDVDRLADAMSAHGVTSFFITTALFNAVIDARPDAFDGVRHVLFGGEQVSLPHVARAFARLGPGRLVHVYGPTETTVFATAHTVNAIDARLGTVPIGTAIANTRLYVLDAAMRPVPRGVAGELYIGGDGVARGYLARPELTAERFADSPFVAGDRLYRTGDLVRQRDDGALVFVGRRDHQVKIRGFRIEPGEVEAAIARHAGVKECLVVVQADEQGGKRLCAYVVPHEAASIADALFAHLRGTLPEYMVPAAIAELAAFPLNANGKVDRAALPPAVPRRAVSVAPRDAREAALAGVWRALLALDDVGVHDNFFALGGDSIKAIQLVARLREAGWAVQVPQLLQHQTIAELAPLLAEPAADTPAPAFRLDAAERDAILSDLDLL